MSAILYVSGSNMGISRIAEGLTRQAAPSVSVASAGTDVNLLDRGVDEDARQACAEIGARCDGDPLQMTASLADRADIVVVLGDVDVSGHVAPDVETIRWRFHDPIDDGIEGLERYRHLRDFLRERVIGVLRELGEAPQQI